MRTRLIGLCWVVGALLTACAQSRPATVDDAIVESRALLEATMDAALPGVEYSVQPSVMGACLADFGDHVVGEVTIRLLGDPVLAWGEVAEGIRQYWTELSEGEVYFDEQVIPPSRFLVTKVIDGIHYGSTLGGTTDGFSMSASTRCYLVGTNWGRITGLIVLGILGVLLGLVVWLVRRKKTNR